MNNSNPNTRALVSALRCDHRDLRFAAVKLIDQATSGSMKPRHAVMMAFNASPRTADAILLERARVTKSGARKARAK